MISRFSFRSFGNVVENQVSLSRKDSGNIHRMAAGTAEEVVNSVIALICAR